MKVKIKLGKNAILPTYAKEGDAGMDIYATSMTVDEYGNIEYGTELYLEIPEGYCGLIFPRSSNSKKDLVLSNSIGLIDSGYRGEVKLKFKGANRFQKVGFTNDGNNDLGSLVMDKQVLNKELYIQGDKIAQIVIMPYPKVEFVEVDELSNTERGAGGFGSTGK